MTTFALLSLALRLQWYNGSYSTVDGRRLIALANTLRALVLGGVHSPVASRANVLRRMSEFSELRPISFQCRTL